MTLLFFSSGSRFDLPVREVRTTRRTSVLPRAFVVLEQHLAAFYNFKNENVAVRGSVARIGNFGTCV